MPPQMGQPSNPFGYGLASFANSFANEAEKNTTAKRNEAGKQQFEDWKTRFMEEQEAAKTGRANEGNKTKIATAHVAHSAKAGSDQIKQDQLAYKTVQDAKTNHATFIKDALSKNIMAQTMNPNDPRYGQML